MSARGELLEQQLRDFLQGPSVAVARVIIGEVDRLADRLDQVEKDMIKLRQEMKKR